MSDTYNANNARARAGGGGAVTVKGERAGESFATSAEEEDKANRDEYLKQAGLAGLGNAAKRSKIGQTKIESDYQDWLKKRKATASQGAAAIIAKPSPKPSPKTAAEETP